MQPPDDGFDNPWRGNMGSQRSDEALRAAVSHLWRYCRPFYAGNELAPLSGRAMRALWPVLYYLRHDPRCALPEGSGEFITLASVPKKFRERWAEAYYAAAARSALLSREMDRLLAALHEADIPAILLKGAILAENLYPNPALRPMSDLDILVPHDRVLDAREVLERLGYRALHPIPLRHPHPGRGHGSPAS